MVERVGRAMRCPWDVLVFVASVLPCVLLVALLLPLGEAPDEATQVARVASLLRGEVIGHRERLPHPADGEPFTMAGFDINPGWMAPMAPRPRGADGRPAPLDRAAADVVRALVWGEGRGFVEASNTAAYAPPLYLAAAAGFAAGRLAGLRPAAAVRVGRLANGLAYVVVAAAAIGLAVRGRTLLCVALGLPMSVFIAGSIGQDGLLIAVAALASAALGRAMAGGGERWYWAGMGCLALVILAKPPYLPLAALALLPMQGPGPGRVPGRLVPGRLGPGWRAAWGVALAVGPALAWVAAAQRLAIVSFWRAPYHPGPLFDGDPATLFRSADPAAQLRLVLGHPLAAVHVLGHSLEIGFVDLVRSMVGVLGWLDLQLPGPAYRLWYGLLVVVGLAALPVLAGWRGWRVGVPLMGLALAGSVVAVYLAQYLSWTDVGLDRVDGVQGRYVIPLLALAGVVVAEGAGRTVLALRAAVLAVVAGRGAVVVAAVVDRYFL